MANRCVSLDATWAHLPAPPPPPQHHTWLSPAADDAITAALWASMAPSSASSYCGSAASPTPSTSTTTTSSSAASAEILAGGGARAATRPSGRVSKRKPRPSRRAHTTYITADPADFRRMVQEITGFPVPGAHTAYPSASASSAPHAAAALACVLPTLDTSAFLLDRASPPPPPPQPQPGRKNDKTPTTTMASTPPQPPAAASSLLLQELEELIGASAFPTLESWGMI